MLPVKPEPYTRAEQSRRGRQRAAMTLAPIHLDRATADALLRLLERSGRTRADLIRHLIRCADLDADPMV